MLFIAEAVNGRKELIRQRVIKINNVTSIVNTKSYKEKIIIIAK